MLLLRRRRRCRRHRLDRLQICQLLRGGLRDRYRLMGDGDRWCSRRCDRHRNGWYCGTRQVLRLMLLMLMWLLLMLLWLFLLMRLVMLLLLSLSAWRHHHLIIK